MEKKYLEYIEKFLIESPVLVPLPTLTRAQYKADPSIKVIVFDIYGTIMISASGDIDESEITAENLRTSLDAAGILLDESITDPQKMLTEMLDAFRKEIIRVHEEESGPDKPYPEIDILQIWETIIYKNRDREFLHLNGPLCIKCFTFVFEVLCNNIYPMPGMKEVIAQLSERNIPLGIISNAQFYTPLIMNFFLHGKLTDDEVVHPFDKDLTVYSYQHKRSKPDDFLFEIVKRQCKEKYNIHASEILFLGNDMFRDIYPAHRAGFKTALFAGDSRSLRLRKDNPELDHIAPDHIITDLYQLLKIIT